MKFLTTIFCCFILLQSFSQSKYAKNFAFVNKKGEVVFDAKYKWVGDFHNGLCVIHKYTIEGQKAYWNRGFIDETGKIVIPAIYEDVYDFKYGVDVTWAKKRGESRYILIDKKGNRVGNLSYEKVGFWQEGIGTVIVDNKDLKLYNGDYGKQYGFVNTKGEIILDPEGGYFDVSSFSEGLACITQKNAKGYGFIDKTGKVVIPLELKQNGVSTFKNGLARAKKNGKTGLIDRTGKFVVQPVYGTVSGFGDSLLTVGFGNAFNDFGFVDFNNKVVIKGQYDRASSFEGGFAEVSKNDLEGIINKKGEFVLPMKYGSVYNQILEHGYFMTNTNNNWQYFDKEGKEITHIEAYSRRYKDQGAFSIYDRETKTGQFYDTSGKLVSNAKFCKVGQFSDGGLAKVLLCDGVDYKYGNLISESSSNPTTPEPEPTVLTNVPSKTQNYINNDYKTSFEVPVTPTVNVKDDNTSVTITSGGKMYSVVAVAKDLGKNVKKSKIQDLLTKGSDAGVKSLGGEILSKEELMIDGQPGLKYVLLKDGVKYSYLSAVKGALYYNWIFVATEANFHYSANFEKSIKML